MKIFKNYKKLYNIELNNRKLLEQAKKENDNWNIILQKSLIEAENQIKILKEKNTKLKIELEDIENFFEQEKQCTQYLRKERTNLRTKIKKLGGEWKDETTKRN